MASRVAVVKLNDNVQDCFELAVKLIGSIDDLNTAKRSVVIKVGVFNHRKGQHATVDVVNAVANSFNKVPKIYLAESNNYKGTGSERLQIWKSLFNEQVVPFNLSDDTETRQVKIADETIGFSHILFKPNIFVSTHALRRSDRGTILKNLLGLIPDKKKMRFHRKLTATLLDAYEAIGGIDLAVLDATYTYPDLTSVERIETDTLLVSRDAVAVETVGAALVGLNPMEIPVIREAVNRGLGKGSLSDIEVVGVSFESLEQEFADLAKAYGKPRGRQDGPQTWGGLAHRAFKGLIREGFFRLPHRRTVKDVAKALESKGIPIEGREEKIAGFLARRVRSGVLKTTTSEDGRVYWTE